MTNAEAIKYYDRQLTICESNITMCQDSDDGELRCALRVYASEHDRLTAVLYALREQAERDKGCDFCAADYSVMSGSRMTIDGMHKGCTAKFCPNCGRRLEVIS